ncbi:MAG TPA: tRNA-dihydrouridine synthase family protein [Bacteriovoracaceae bacterium]|nr:tRNA-dihydrouridine synthase family protein [Bacteriovoracaceae bacterium]
MEMNRLAPIPSGSLFFAPMEGITDESFRKTILKLYPEWDYIACDFLRVPSAGRYPVKHLIRHMGRDLFEIPWVKEKTMYQILTSHRAFTVEMVRDVDYLGIPWMDVNLGCPSPTVCKNGGGSSLLKDLKTLAPLMRSIRENFKGRLSAKIRVGYSDTKNFDDSIRMLNDEGIELITVHGRTRDQMYKEPANWDFIARAVAISKVPIIGNGDVWSIADIDRMFLETGCHAVMAARGALQSPWMAQDYKRNKKSETDSEKYDRMREFFREYRTQLEAENISARGLLKQSKSVSRFMLNGVVGSEGTRRKLMLSQALPEFYDTIENL